MTFVCRKTIGAHSFLLREASNVKDWLTLLDILSRFIFFTKSYIFIQNNDIISFLFPTESRNID